MRSAIVFHLAPDVVTLQRWESGELRDAVAVETNPEGFDAIAGRLRAMTCEQALLLVDVAEEEFVTEEVPRAFGRGQRQLLDRRAERLFRATPLRTRHRLHRADSSSRHVRFLFSGLTHPAALDPLMSCLLAAGIPLRAISSVPHVSARLPRLLGLRDAALLLASEQPGGLRLSYFADGELRASRLTPFASGAPAMVEEFGRTRRYLNNAGLLPHGTLLSVYCLASEPLLRALERLPLPDGLELRLCAIDDVASRLHLPYCPALGASSVFAGLFLRAPRNQYAARRQLHSLAVRRGAAAIEAGGLIVALVLCLTAMTAARNALQADADSRALRAAADYAMATNVPVRPLPDGVTAGRLENSVQAVEELMGVEMRPDAALETLGKALKAHRPIHLTRIEWAASRNCSFSDLTPEAARTFSMPVADPETVAHRPCFGLFVEGMVTIRDGALRRASAEVAALVDALKETPGLAGVELVSPPVDSERELRGTTGRETPPESGRPFSLRALLRS